MADLNVLANGYNSNAPALIAPVTDQFDSKPFMSAVALNAGDLVFINSAGKVDKAQANSLGTVNTLVGIALQKVGVNQAVDVFLEGLITGYDLSALAYGALVYTSTATAGAISDTKPTGTGNVVVPLGRVVSMTDPALTKVLYIDIEMWQSYTALP